MKTNDHTPNEAAQRGIDACSHIAIATCETIQAVCVAQPGFGTLDVGLSVVRGVIDGLLSSVPVDLKPESMPANARKYLRSLEAAKRAINEELGRTIDVVRTLDAVRS